MTSPGWDPDPYANQTAPGAGVPGQGFPGQGFPGQVGPVGSAGMTPAEQAAYRQGQRDLLAQARQPRMTVFRVICGILWAAISVGFAFGVIANITGHGSAGDIIVGAIISVLAGWYDYRIWTLKARRLFLII
jgi:hypothetical protein